MADISTLDAAGKAVPLVEFDLINGCTDCLGGGGEFASAQDFMTLLKVVKQEIIRRIIQIAIERIDQASITSVA